MRSSLIPFALLFAAALAVPQPFTPAPEREQKCTAKPKIMWKTETKTKTSIKTKFEDKTVYVTKPPVTKTGTTTTVVTITETFTKTPTVAPEVKSTTSAAPPDEGYGDDGYGDDSYDDTPATPEAMTSTTIFSQPSTMVGGAASTPASSNGDTSLFSIKDTPSSTSTPSPSPSPASTSSASPSPSPSPSSTTSSAPASTATGSDKDTCLSEHNKWRGQHGAPPLTWSDELASFAENWSKDCTMHHSTADYGENLAMGSKDIASAISMWMDEAKDYNPNNALSAAHFSQVIWKATTELGCYNRKCDNGDYLVCEYKAAGNVVGAFAANVQV
ncbi:hypothetical protein H072_2050 [Dactylellina haptotyla CBS 200.50]|uniref:SCP domain-containing protein n=1 Tax=Dactylellina haptotyla (strain CBS 200.50) TaxID=1284197 RepID=S8ALQ4_DACHA|nr:hypothetical protein H072_2050 [Dactylellina haptotyla CBS 200.50]